MANKTDSDSILWANVIHTTRPVHLNFSLIIALESEAETNFSYCILFDRLNNLTMTAMLNHFYYDGLAKITIYMNKKPQFHSS